VEAIPDAIAIVDREGVIADVNRHMVTLTGQARADLLGVPLSDCFVEEDRAGSCVRGRVHPGVGCRL
jgi:PAS domain S-box-containing protein